MAAFFTNAATCMGADAGVGARPPTLAVVGIVSGGEKPTDPNLAGAFISLLEVQLSGQGNLKLLERQRRDALLKEQQLSLTALADVQAPLRLGRLLGAELIVWGQPAQIGASAGLLMRVVEPATGVVRGLISVPLNQATVLGAAGEAARRIATIASSAKPPVATIAVGTFENAGRFARLGSLSFLMRDGMTEELVKRPSLLVLQRSTMQPLLDEMDLVRLGLTKGGGGGGALPPREATYFLSGSFSDVVGSDPPRVRVRMELTGAAGGRAVVSDQSEARVDELAAVYARWGALVAEKTGTKGVAATTVGTPVASPAEAEVLKQRAVSHLAGTGTYIKVPTVTVRRDPFALSASWGQSVHAALVRQAIEELEASLFLQPKDLATKLLLASAYLVGEPGTWEPNRAIELCRDIERADPNGAFGLDAQRMIPRAYASALNQAEANHLADAPERARACVNAYLKLADQSANRDLAESMKAVVDAEFWSFNPPLNDVAGAIACLRRNVALAARTDPAKLPVDCDGLHQTAQAISWMVLAKPERADECRQLLRPWSGHASPHLRYLGLTNLAEIERRTGHFKLAGEGFAAVVKLCVSEKTKWFSVREERARLDAAGAYLKAGDDAAGFAILQPQIDVLKAGGMPSYEAAVALGELYEATGQFDRAIELYRQMMRRYQSGSAAADHLRTLLRAHPEKNATDVKVDYAIRQKGSSDVLCAGEQLIWTSNLYEVNWYDPRTERGGAVHRAAGDIIIVRLAWTSNHQLWAGTNGHGLWRLDTQTAAPSLADKDPWFKVAGLPDDNVTCMVAGDEGDLFAAVGVTTPGVGAAVKGGVVRIDAEGKVHPLDQAGGPRIAPDHMVWLAGHLWSKSQEGVFHLDLKAGTWKRLYIGRSIYIGSGIERILLIDIDRRDRIRRALWAPPATTGGEGDLHEIINAPELLIGLSLESPNAFWFSGRAQGTSGGRELQCVDKTTGRMTTINEAVGPPFSTVNDAIWFQDRLWLATYKGLVTVDAVHFPKAAAPAATAPATRRATENH